MLQEAVNLPLEIQIALTSGYAAYIVGYGGKRENHRSIDTAMISLCFGLLSIVVFRGLVEHTVFAFAVGLSFITSIILSVFWRKYLVTLLNKFFSNGANFLG